MNTNEPLSTTGLPTPAGDPEAPHRGPGAPFGNQNAFKHGFYAKCLPPEQEAILQEAVGLNDLRPEIAFMRVKLMSLISNPNTPDELLIKAIRAITRLVDVQHKIW